MTTPKTFEEWWTLGTLDPINCRRAIIANGAWNAALESVRAEREAAALLIEAVWHYDGDPTEKKYVAVKRTLNAYRAAKKGKSI